MRSSRIPTPIRSRLQQQQQKLLLLRKHRDGSCLHHHHHHHLAQQQQRRSFAIYGVGEGWTGALTRQHIFKTIPGHFDEDVTEPIDDNNNNYDDYDYDYDAAAGWGASAVLDAKGTLRIVGRPHDLVSLLRLNRMPKLVQRWIHRNKDTSDTTPVGKMISNLIGWATGTANNNNNNNSNNNNHNNTPRIQQIACGAGFLAVIAECGSLYTMGVNNRGQCGTGTISNNVWTPQPVRGLSSTSLPIGGGGDKRSDDAAAEQDQPVVRVCLGFQHGYALSREGRVYSWGKASRGQLGRVVDADQDPWARPIEFDPKERVVQIGAGFHHGALLTRDNKVYTWGKNTSRTNGDDDDDETEPNTKGGNDNDNDDGNGNGNDEEQTTAGTGTAHDARKPQRVLGLPRDTRVERISCGSHHTAVLMEDGSIHAVGIASDEPVPLLDPVELVPPGVLDLPVRQFEAHYDRTTVIDRKGAVYQVHLWNDETLREYAYFTPSYVDYLLDRGESIRSIHRGWRHTLIVTDNKQLK
eukprot:jgi/Psemu1/207003/e_gw1.422.34.1